MARRSSKSAGPRPAGGSRPMAKVLTIRATPSTAGPSTSSKPSDQKPAGHAQTPAASSGANVNDEVDNIPIADLTLDTPLIPFAPKRRVPAKPFHFLSLPSELRIRVYEYFFLDINGVIDLAPENHKRIHGKLRLMRVCKQIHAEATHFFYGTRVFRMFPTHPGRYFKTKKPLLARMKPLMRSNTTCLELRLGPGWSQPPRGWVVNDALGLKDCVNVRRLRVFVECDPSDNIFKGFRQSESFYEGFCRNLFNAVLKQMPAIDVIEFDAWPSVKKKGAMMTMLIDVATKSKKLIQWGSERGWTDDMDKDDDARPGLQFVDGVPVKGYGHEASLFWHSRNADSLMDSALTQ